MIPTNNAGLLMVPETNQCLGFLLDAGQGRGIYDVAHGHIQCSAEEAAAHNKVLSAAYLKGLDLSCEVGQGATFYYARQSGQVTTWHGDIVANGTPGCRYRESVYFTRGGKKFRGRVQKDADCVFFKRVA